jgi:histidinol-phosphate aminotransferase
MIVSRRKLLRGIGAGAIASLASPAISSVEAATDVGGRLIYLDRNENPYGPSESAVAAMRDSARFCHRYPEADALREKIAAHHQVTAEQVVLGCGSTELLRMAAEAFLLPGMKLITAVPTCPLIGSFARQKGSDVVEVPLTGERAHDLQAMLARSNGSTGMVYICNPNNPTGTLTGRRNLEQFLQQLPAHIPVVMDEAYHHYVPPTTFYSSFLEHPALEHPGFDRMVVTRTFSAIYGLAGMRIGYAVTSPELAKRLSQFQLPFGENAAGIRGAMAALDDGEYVRRSAELNSSNRQRFVNKSDVRYAGVSHTETNFVLVPLDHPMEEVIAHFRKNQVLVGPRFQGLDSYLRVSIGRPEEVDAFWRVWDMLPHKPMKH